MTDLDFACIYMCMVKDSGFFLRISSDTKERWKRAAEADRRTLSAWIELQCDRAADTAGVEAAPKAPKPRGKRAKS